MLVDKVRQTENFASFLSLVTTIKLKEKFPNGSVFDRHARGFLKQWVCKPGIQILLQLFCRLLSAWSREFLWNLSIRAYKFHKTSHPFRKAFNQHNNLQGMCFLMWPESSCFCLWLLDVDVLERAHAKLNFLLEYSGHSLHPSILRDVTSLFW